MWLSVLMLKLSLTCFIFFRVVYKQDFYGCSFFKCTCLCDDLIPENFLWTVPLTNDAVDEMKPCRCVWAWGSKEGSVARLQPELWKIQPELRLMLQFHLVSSVWAEFEVTYRMYIALGAALVWPACSMIFYQYFSFLRQFDLVPI